ncbi:MAG TPA: glycosyltransferase [Chloroflexota bacterium]
MSGAGPRVSIGMPVYNGERFIREALDSIVQQTFRDWELIISDNASSDGTAEICREYMKRDDRIRYHRNERNVGLARNFDRTVELSSGEYFKLANADDTSGPTLIDMCVEVLDRHPEVVLCYGRTTLIDEAGRPFGLFEDRLDLRQPRAVDRFRLAMARTRLINILQGVIRRDALRCTGLLGAYMGSDMVLVAELALYGQFYELPEQLFFRRMHKEAFSSLTVARQRAFVDPDAQGRWYFYVWRHHGELLRAVWRARLPVSEKAALTCALLRRGVMARGELVRELVQGLGVFRDGR